jgi:hypothetical protein
MESAHGMPETTQDDGDYSRTTHLPQVLTDGQRGEGLKEAEQTDREGGD